MENNIGKTISCALGGLGAYLCGLNWEIIFIWFFLMTIDTITGVIKAMKDGQFSSKDMKDGLYKKAGEFFLIFALILGQRVAQINGINVPVGSVFTGAFCFKDLGSILENVVDMKVDVPEIIKRWLKISNESINENKNEVK
ncbi:phage holin family protein [Inediibacterium massiliense]|uniref:phage holin family protein n=1 Tax=Inediibacterium massiliense TaxID=1658111 RepID=UPI0006B69FD1|nr:phage holin family protein [Inediibacterium massiliense]